MKKSDIKKRLEYLRQELRQERISYWELAELQGLQEHIDINDVELLEAAGVRENEMDVDLVEECIGAECTVHLHFSKLEFGTIWERAELIRNIKYAVKDVSDDVKFTSGDRVDIETEDPAMVREILKRFGW